MSSAEIDQKLFIKKKKGDDKDQKKKVAEMEAQIYRLIEILGEQREMTRDNVERKQARTEDERIEDEDDEFIEEEEEGILYTFDAKNQLNKLSLGIKSRKFGWFWENSG